MGGIAIGLVSEVAAYHRRLWLYRRPAYPVLNVLLGFGLVMGALSGLHAALGGLGLFAAGFGIGLAYEAANLLWLDWWYFPDDRLLGLRGKWACALGVSVAWGMVPVALAMTRRVSV